MTKYKTLLERLKPEIKAQIEADRALYPHMVEGVEEQLAKEFFASHVQYGIALDIMNYYTAAFGAQPMNFYECFVGFE